ncbi:MAG TPA: aminoglycoside phosphotransferase family protein [Thermoanaerobaculia bacterium]|nr:aminoglycoside phosphotransferase family protein [Thermoanaerobaculia bacterium]
MLAPDDAALVRRDPRLAGLETVLDAERLLTELVRRTGLSIRGASSSYLRYKPGVSCLVLWKLDMGASSILVHAKAYGEAQRNKFDARREGRIEPRHTQRIILGDRSTIVYVFPDDALMPALARMNDVEFLEEIFPETPHLRVPEWRTLRYKPERRHVAFLGGPDSPLAVLKLHGSDGYRRAQRLIDKLPPAASFQIARQVGGSRNARAVAYEWLPGEPLSKLIASGPTNDAVVRSATAIAELHDHDHRKERGPDVSPADRASNLRALSADLQDLSPRLAPRLGILAERIAERIVALPQGCSVIHGDFYAEQIVVGSESIGLIDLDNACIGDRESDLGNFLAHLELSGDTQTGDTFVDAYRRASRKSIPQTRLHVETALGLYRLLPRPFRTRGSGWEEAMETILERAEQLEEGSRESSRASFSRMSVKAVEVIDEIGAAGDPLMPQLTLATDPGTMQQELSKILGGDGDRASLRSIRIARHKPGRRCMIEYTLDIDGRQTSLIGRLRARGPQKRTFRLHSALWEGTFGPFAEDGIMIPEPIARIDSIHLWLQRKVDGRDATAALPGDDWETLAERIALTAKKLHDSRVQSVNRHTTADEMRILRDRLREVAIRNPQSGHRLERLLAACEDVASRLPARTDALIHRDFYADHILFDGDRTFLIDLDLAAQGDPALDIGNFVAHLTEQSLRLFGDPDALSDRVEAIVTGYRRLAPDAGRESIEAYAALSLARLVALSTVVRGRAHLFDELLNLTESRLARFSERIPH